MKKREIKRQKKLQKRQERLQREKDHRQDPKRKIEQYTWGKILSLSIAGLVVCTVVVLIIMK